MSFDYHGTFDLNFAVSGIDLDNLAAERLTLAGRVVSVILFARHEHDLVAALDPAFNCSRSNWSHCS
jgi:hypothetical protein